MLLSTVVLVVLVSVVQSAERNQESRRVLLHDVALELKESYSKFNVSLLGSCGRVTLQNGEDIEEWKPPQDFPSRYVYYLAGYDDENRPVWVGEFGKWNVRKALEDGQLREFDMYLKQLAHSVVKSVHERSTEDDPVTEAIVVIDCENLSFEQVGHLPTVAFVLGIAREYQVLISTYLADALIINANYAAEIMINLIKPILGGVFEKITVYGNNKAFWVPKLLRKVPKKSVPEWYGGTKDFKPVKIYG